MASVGRFVRQNLFQQIRIHFKEMRTNNDILFEGKWRWSSSGALCSLINHLRARHRTVALGAGVQLAAVVFYPHFTTQLLKMAEFAGKYKLVSSENFDEYMKAVGVGFATRKLANAATPVQEIQVNGDEFYIKTATTFKTTEIKFKLGEEFDETTADGRQVKTVITKNGNKLIQEQKGDKPSTIVREFDGDTMKMTLTVGDITSVRVYKKEE